MNERKKQNAVNTSTLPRLYEIKKDYINNGKSLIMETIISEKRKGGVAVLTKTLKAGDVCQMFAGCWMR